MAATRRGWVHPIFLPPLQKPASFRNWGRIRSDLTFNKKIIILFIL